jgi:hypothetical protein
MPVTPVTPGTAQRAFQPLDDLLADGDFYAAKIVSSPCRMSSLTEQSVARPAESEPGITATVPAHSHYAGGARSGIPALISRAGDRSPRSAATIDAVSACQLAYLTADIRVLDGVMAVSP